MLQHLLIGMIAPVGLVMGAPITLVLRTLSPPAARKLVRLMGLQAVQAAANPVSALLLNLGGMAALYLTPLYGRMMSSSLLCYAVHVHFIAAGCLYSWVIAGPDPAPHRPSVPWRLVVLGIAVVFHSVLAQMLYAGWHVAVQASAAERQAAAEWMYYGGDMAEMLLAFAMVTSWQPTRRVLLSRVVSQ